MAIDAYDVQREVSARILSARLRKLAKPADPAVGAENSVTVPSGVTWIIYGIAVTLATSAVVANREPHIVLDDGQVTFYRIASVFQLAASLSARFYWSAGQGYEVNHSSNSFAGLPTPPLVLPGGYRIRTTTINLDAGDAYSSLALYMDEISASEIEQQLEWINRDTPIGLTEGGGE